jgi:hypothetical protein
MSRNNYFRHQMKNGSLALGLKTRFSFHQTANIAYLCRKNQNLFEI